MGLKTAKGRLFFLLLLVIFLPLLQFVFHFITSGKLNGAITNAEDVSFKMEQWWDGSYQKQKEKFLNDGVGFRPDFVRLNNQLDYWLFSKLHARGVLAGKDGFLFEEPYIDEYNGSNYVEDTAFEYQLSRLKQIQDTIERAGKTFVFVVAASKAYYCPDKFPDYGRYRHNYGINNYSEHIRIVDSLDIHTIDINQWFLSAKDTSSPKKVFSKKGTHWTRYGAMLAGDTLIKYLSAARHINLPSFEITKFTYSETPQSPDADLAEGLNLIVPLQPEKYCYPEYRYNTDSTRDLPKMIFIGDSFVWPLVYNGLIAQISKGWEFWYYFNEVFKDGHDGKLTIDEYDWHKALEETDCLVFVYNPTNLKSIQSKNGLIDALYSHYYPARH